MSFSIFIPKYVQIPVFEGNKYFYISMNTVDSYNEINIISMIKDKDRYSYKNYFHEEQSHF